MIYESQIIPPLTWWRTFSMSTLTLSDDLHPSKCYPQRGDSQHPTPNPAPWTLYRSSLRSLGLLIKTRLRETTCLIILTDLS